ncbi:MAG: TolC family protein [Bacteroidota bacterium]
MTFKINGFSFLGIVLIILSSYSIKAQTITPNKVFPIDSFLNWVATYHPIMQQANLLDDEADALRMKARGSLDPKVYGDYEDKSFDQKNYFQVGEAGLKIPTWFGVDVKAAYTWSNGIFLDGSDQLPANGQAVLGVEIPLVQGLLFDQRRAQIQQAELYRAANEAERRDIVNNLMLDAAEGYWKWVYQFQVLQVFENSLRLAEDRFDLIKESYLQGDKPAIDTLESLIQIQNFGVQRDQAIVDYETARLELSNFLWLDDLVPLEVSSSLKPSDLESIEISDIPQRTNSFFQNMDSFHPQLRSILVKQQQLEIKERLKLEMLKPSLNFSYNFLGNGFQLVPSESENAALSALLTENYKWGLNFSYPLFLRKERGSLQLVRIEQLNNNYKFRQKRLEIENKVNAITQQIETTQQQLATQETVLSNYQRLLEVENIKFRIGESSIFLLNNREQKLIDTQLKVLKFQMKYQQLQYKLEWAMGRLAR